VMIRYYMMMHADDAVYSCPPMISLVLSTLVTHSLVHILNPASVPNPPHPRPHPASQSRRY